MSAVDDASAAASPLLYSQDGLGQDEQLEIDTVNGQLADLDVSQDGSVAGPPSPHLTRTVAIIKNHALQHRFDIERKIQEAGFEIVKERQMEFDVETDPDTLFELFGEDAESFAEGPVWVYVLERRRAVEVCINLMGSSDPTIARQEAPNSIRALYGLSASQNGIMGSPDRETAEIQIASLFASSPPFPTSDLPDDHDQYGTVNSATSSQLEALRKATGTSEAGSVRSPGGSSGGRKSVNKLFAARALPATHLNPDIVPRTTKAAALRAGIVQASAIGSMGRLPSSAARAAISKDRHQQTFQHVPGHKRSETITVASTAAPTIAPRLTKAAALRQGIKPESASLKRTPSVTSNGTKAGGAFEGVPGHRRRETITVASTAAPTVAPRMTKAASLRQGPKPPPTSFMFRGPSDSKTPTLSRSHSQSSLSPSRPSTSRPSSQMSMKGGVPLSRTTSRTSSVSAATNGATNGKSTTSDETKPKRFVRTPSSISNPAIAPRTNKSAALRAAKKAEEEEAARKAEERARKAARRRTVGVLPRGIAA